jgi:hypothetical protein
MGGYPRSLLLRPGHRNTGELVVARADDRKFAPIKRYKLAEGDTYAHPVIVGRRILIRDLTHRTLWAIGG